MRENPIKSYVSLINKLEKLIATRLKFKNDAFPEENDLFYAATQLNKYLKCLKENDLLFSNADIQIIECLLLRNHSDYISTTFAIFMLSITILTFSYIQSSNFTAALIGLAFIAVIFYMAKSFADTSNSEMLPYTIIGFFAGCLVKFIKISFNEPEIITSDLDIIFNSTFEINGFSVVLLALILLTISYTDRKYKIYRYFIILDLRKLHKIYLENQCRIDEIASN
ncbi:MAG: hypothetical protein AB1782_20175 [Cyanobacteriota bacterium]